MTRTAVILCGGQGSRMGPLCANTPKPLLPVRGQPILWHIIHSLYHAGVRRMIFPLGYLGDQVRAFLATLEGTIDVEFVPVDTGLDTAIGARLAQIESLIEPGESFLLTNGDTLIDLDLERKWAEHLRSGAAITLLTCAPQSHYGLVLMDGGRPIRFARGLQIEAFMTGYGNHTYPAYVYSGLAVISKAALEDVAVATLEDFEIGLFGAMIDSGRAHLIPISGYWFAIDTPKDLSLANSGDSEDPRAVGALRLTEKLLNLAVA